MTRLSIHLIGSSFVALSLLVSAGEPLIAQGTSTGGAADGIEKNKDMNRAVGGAGDRVEGRRGFDWGWLGLVGLIGLMGLSGRGRTNAIGYSPGSTGPGTGVATDTNRG